MHKKTWNSLLRSTRPISLRSWPQINWKIVLSGCGPELSEVENRNTHVRSQSLSMLVKRIHHKIRIPVMRCSDNFELRAQDLMESITLAHTKKDNGKFSSPQKRCHYRYSAFTAGVARFQHLHSALLLLSHKPWLLFKYHICTLYYILLCMYPWRFPHIIQVNP